MEKVIIDGCECFCETAEIVAKKAVEYNPWEIGIIVFITVVIVIALIIGFKKLKGNDEEEGQYEQGNDYF